MPFAPRLALQLICLTGVLAGPLPSRPSPRILPKGETPVSGMYPEVRLRKLHLVRPDLIPYPIAYEVCC